MGWTGEAGTNTGSEFGFGVSSVIVRRLGELVEDQVKVQNGKLNLGELLDQVRQLVVVNLAPDKAHPVWQRCVRRTICKASAAPTAHAGRSERVVNVSGGWAADAGLQPAGANGYIHIYMSSQ